MVGQFRHFASCCLHTFNMLQNANLSHRKHVFVFGSWTSDYEPSIQTFVTQRQPLFSGGFPGLSSAPDRTWWGYGCEQVNTLTQEHPVAARPRRRRPHSFPLHVKYLTSIRAPESGPGLGPVNRLPEIMANRLSSVADTTHHTLLGAKR
jgi:hypothetical protein